MLQQWKHSPFFFWGNYWIWFELDWKYALLVAYKLWMDILHARQNECQTEMLWLFSKGCAKIFFIWLVPDANWIISSQVVPYSRQQAYSLSRLNLHRRNDCNRLMEASSNGLPIFSIHKNCQICDANDRACKRCNSGIGFSGWIHGSVSNQLFNRKMRLYHISYVLRSFLEKMYICGT